jgi:DNA modification methylase
MANPRFSNVFRPFNSNKGDTVLDNVMGSGGCGVSALQLGRKFIGIEQDEKYFNLCVTKLIPPLLAGFS